MNFFIIYIRFLPVYEKKLNYFSYSENKSSQETDAYWGTHGYWRYSLLFYLNSPKIITLEEDIISKMAPMRNNEYIESSRRELHLDIVIAKRVSNKKFVKIKIIDFWSAPFWIAKNTKNDWSSFIRFTKRKMPRRFRSFYTTFNYHSLFQVIFSAPSFRCL